MAELLGTVGLVGFGLVFLALGLVTLVAAIRTLRSETLPRFVEARPGPLDALLTIVASTGLQLLVAAFMLATAYQSFIVALGG